MRDNIDDGCIDGVCPIDPQVSPPITTNTSNNNSVPNVPINNGSSLSLRGPNVIYFTNDNCPACELVKDDVALLRFKYPTQFTEIVLSDPDGRDLFADYNVTGTPTLIVAQGNVPGARYVGPQQIKAASAGGAIDAVLGANLNTDPSAPMLSVSPVQIGIGLAALYAIGKIIKRLLD